MILRNPVEISLNGVFTHSLARLLWGGRERIRIKFVLRIVVRSHVGIVVARHTERAIRKPCSHPNDDADRKQDTEHVHHANFLMRNGVVQNHVVDGTHANRAQSESRQNHRALDETHHLFQTINDLTPWF